MPESGRNLDTLLNAIVSCMGRLQFRRFKNANNDLIDRAGFYPRPASHSLFSFSLVR